MAVTCGNKELIPEPSFVAVDSLVPGALQSCKLHWGHVLLFQARRPRLGDNSSRDCSHLLPDVARCAVTTQYAGIPHMHGESLAQVCDGMFSTAGHASVDLACVVCYAVASCVVTPTRKVVWYRGVSKPAEEEASFAASPFVGVAGCQRCGA
jgi:hypothetical protein